MPEIGKTEADIFFKSRIKTNEAGFWDPVKTVKLKLCSSMKKKLKSIPNKESSNYDKIKIFLLDVSLSVVVGTMLI